MLGNAELALGSLSPTSPARASISRISVAARRAADLCRQMLTYSGKAPSQQEPVVVSELIEEMAHLLRASISRRVSLDLDLPSGLPPVQADASQLRQVVLNLIVNASEAIGERDGSIGLTVTASPCDDELLRKTALHDDLPPGMYVTIEVADTGCGMDEATLNRIFEPFYTTKFTGRGLGLAAVLGIIRAHQGALSVQSEPGQGTTFTIRLPALTAPSLASPPREASSQKPWRGKGTILLADDEESLLVLGVDVLETMGFTVLTACNGHEAVEIYRQRAGEIDLVVLDLTMPLMDGAAAFRELQRLNPEVRVVLASGYVEEDVSTALRRTGPGGHFAEAVHHRQAARPPGRRHARGALAPHRPHACRQSACATRATGYAMRSASISRSSRANASAGTAPGAASPTLAQPAATALRRRSDGSIPRGAQATAATMASPAPTVLTTGTPGASARQVPSGPHQQRASRPQGSPGRAWPRWPHARDEPPPALPPHAPGSARPVGTIPPGWVSGATAALPRPRPARPRRGYRRWYAPGSHEPGRVRA